MFPSRHTILRYVGCIIWKCVKIDLRVAVAVTLKEKELIVCCVYKTIHNYCFHVP